MNRECEFLDPSIIALMQSFAVSQTDQALNDHFGISYNIWRKLKSGRPVRVSLARRLVDRVSKLEAQRNRR